MSSKTCLVTTILAAIVFALSGWGGIRASKYGLNNIFSREHIYVDDRPLTDAVALELTREALRADGQRIEHLVPYKSFARNSINENNGYVLWGPSPDGEPWQFLVSITRNDSGRYHVRAYRGK
jgi:hypothetical protein